MSTQQKVLLVDDNEGFRKAFKRSLRRWGYKVVEARNRTEAQSLWGKHRDLRLAFVDLEMSDSEYPKHESGWHLIAHIKKTPRRSCVCAVTAHTTRKDFSKAVAFGADAWIDKARGVEKCRAIIVLCSAWLTKGSGMSALRRSLELRNPYTAGHCSRVAQYIRLILPKLQKADGTNFDLGACLIAAEVHDLGKLALPDEILLGDRELTAEEREFVSRHPRVGADTLLELGKEFTHAARLVLLHHRFFAAPPKKRKLEDYPKRDLKGKSPGPRGENIPLEARVLAVADCLDALLSARSYRSGMDLDKVREMIKDDKEKFCPDVVDALEKVPRDDLQKVIESGKYHEKKVLTITCREQRLTPGRLRTVLSMLQDIWLPDGSALHRVSLKSVKRVPGGDSGISSVSKGSPTAGHDGGPGADSGISQVVIEMAGEKEEIEEIKTKLDRRKERQKAAKSDRRMAGPVELVDVKIGDVPADPRDSGETAPAAATDNLPS